MKSKIQLVENLYSTLAGNPDIVALLGQFTYSDNGASSLALAYDDVQEFQQLPSLDSCFIVYNLETSNAVPAESMSQLESVILKFFIKGYKAQELAEVLIGQLNGVLIYNYKCDYLSQNDSQDHTVVVRFTAI